MHHGYILYRKKIFSEFINYLAASIIGTSIHFLLLYGLIRFFSFNTLFATTFGALVGAITIYILNYFLIFKSNKRHRETFSKFIAVATFSIIFNGIAMKALISISSWHYLSLQFIATGLVFVSNFILNRCWTFSSPIPEKPLVGDDAKRSAA